MDYPEIRKALDEFWPRMVIRIDELGGYKGNCDEVFNICQEALRKKYEIVVSESRHIIEIGKAIK